MTETHFFGITDPGRVRDNNEDAFLAQPLDGGRVLAAVIDGVGGYEGGEVAAAIAKDCIAELAGKPISDVDAALRSTILEVNKRIIEARKAQPGKDQMACVLTVAIADTGANQFHYAHVGDTRLYLLRGASLVKVSKDHSFVGFLEESNRITEIDAMRHPKRNEVNKVLGVDPNIGMQADYIDASSSPFLPGDILLLCSDGLTDMIGSGEITGILSGSDSIAAKGKALIDAANAAGGRDNVTAVLVQHPKAAKSYEPTMPATKATGIEPLTQTASVAKEQSKKSPITWILLLLCFLLMSVLTWQFLAKKSDKKDIMATAAAPMPKRVRNAAEQQLMNMLAQSADSITIDSALAATPVQLTDSLVLDKTSFRLRGNGLVLRGDSATRGPALYLPSSAAFLLLEDVTFEHFSTAIVANGAVLKLRNVHFRDCGTAVRYGFHFTDTSVVDGVISGEAFITTAQNRNKQ